MQPGLIACELERPNVTLQRAAPPRRPFGLRLNAACHRRSPDMIQWAITAAPVLPCPLCGGSATERSGGRCTVSSVLTHVEGGCWHWLLGVVMRLEAHRGPRARVSYEHNGKFAAAQLWGGLWKNLRKSQRAYCSAPLQHAPLACTRVACVCACAFQSFYLCFPEIQSLIVVTRKIPKPSTRLTSGSVLIASSLSNTHKTVGQDSQRTCDVRPAHCPGICVLSRAFYCL